MFRTKKKDLVVLPSTNIKILEKNAPSFLGHAQQKTKHSQRSICKCQKMMNSEQKKTFPHICAYTHNQRITSMVLP